MFFLFFVLALASLAEAAKDCSLPPTQVTTDDKLKPYQYYSTQEGGFNSGSTCVWQISVPNGTYASISFTVRSGSLEIDTDYGKIRKFPNTYTDKFESLSGLATMSLYPYAAASFNFTVTWTNEPTPNGVASPTKTDNYAVSTFNDLLSNTAVTYNSNAKIALSTSFFMNGPNEDIVVYDGGDTSAPRLGPLVQLLNRLQVVFSSGNAITLFYPLPNKTLDTGILVFNDADNVKDLSCYLVMPVTNVSLNSPSLCIGRSAITLHPTDGQLISLDRISLPTFPWNSFSVYAGGAPSSKGNLLVTYTNTTKYSFPQAYVSGAITVVTGQDENNKGVSFSARTLDAQDDVHYNTGDMSNEYLGALDGYVFSNNYGKKVAQFVHRNVSFGDGDIPNEFSLNFMNVDLPKGATIELLIAGEVKSYNETNIPKPGKMMFYGNTFTITYDTKGASANGLKLHYSLGFTRGNSSTSTSLSALILLISIVMSFMN